MIFEWEDFRYGRRCSTPIYTTHDLLRFFEEIKEYPSDADEEYQTDEEDIIYEQQSPKK